MRKIMALLVVATFGLGLLGCGEQTPKPTDKDKAKPAEATPAETKPVEATPAETK